MIYPLVTGFHWARLRLPVVHRRLSQPAGPGEDRERLSQRRDIHQSAGAPGHEQHLDSGVRRGHGEGGLHPWHDPTAAGREDRCACRYCALVPDPNSITRWRRRTPTSRRHSKTSAQWRCWASTTPRKSAAPRRWRCFERHTWPSIRPKPCGNSRGRGFLERLHAAPAARYRNPVWTNRVGNVDWRELAAEVADDIAIARW